MTIFLYGTDGYRLKKNVDSVIDAYRKKHESAINFYRFDFEQDKNFNDLDSAIKSVSFFDEAKLIVVKNIFTNKNYSEKLISLVQTLDLNGYKSTILMFAENKNKNELQKANKELFGFLSYKNNLAKEIEPLSGVKLSNWVRNKFKENGYSVSPAVVGSLIGIVGNESWALANEINKLSNYSTTNRHLRTASPEYEITEKDIELLVGRKEINNIFELTDAVGSQNRAKAFEMMYRLINSGHDSHYLLSMLVYHFENLLSVSDGSTPKHLHPFVAKKAAAQARRFSKEDLLSKFNYLAELDIASKNGQVNLEDALYNFTVS